MKRIYLYDFDGTIVKINSFPFYVKYLLKSFLVSWDVLNFFHLLFYLFLRKVKYISHEKFKFFILNFKSIDCTAFSEFLSRNINDKVFYELKSTISLGDTVVVTSAAPEIYIVDFLKFNNLIHENVYVFCSFIDHGKLNNNFSDNKVWRLRKEFSNLKSDFDIFLFTDHYDDLPLMKESSEVVLVNPNKRTVLICNDNNIKYNIWRF